VTFPRAYGIPLDAEMKRRISLYAESVCYIRLAFSMFFANLCPGLAQLPQEMASRNASY